MQKDEEPSEAVRECLTILEGTLEDKVNKTLLEMMSIANVFGYENLLNRLGNVTNLLEQMNERAKGDEL